MNRRTFALALMLLAIGLVACEVQSPVFTDTPTPTQNRIESGVAATKTAWAEQTAIVATLTAGTPTAKPTPLPTEISRPVPTQTQIPTPLSVPSTPTSSIPVPTIPSGWKTFAIENYTFSVPGEWVEAFEPPIPLPRWRNFKLKDGSLRLIGVGLDEQQFQLGSSLDTDVNRFAEFLAKQYPTSRLIDKGIFDDGIHRGVYLEITNRGTDGSLSYGFWVAVRVENQTVHINWVRLKEETDTPREIVKILSASISPRR